MEVYYPIEVIDDSYLQNCVLCASIPEEKNTDIFCFSGTQLKLQQFINEYLNIKIKEDDGLPHGVCLPCVKTLNAFHQLLKTSKSSYRKLKSMRDAYQAQMKELKANVKKTITIDGLIETMPCDSVPSPVSNVPSPIGSEQEIVFELDPDVCDVTLDDLPSVPLKSAADTVATDVAAVEGTIVESVVKPVAEAGEETMTEVANETTEEIVENAKIEPVEMEEYSALIPLAKGSQLAFIYLETNAYTTIARLHVIIININETVLADHDKFQETIARITVDTKRRIKMIHERTRENPDFDADQHISPQFLCLTCRCWFYCKEEMVSHFGSLHPTELKQCSQCSEQICGPDEAFNKHLEFHKAVDDNDLELMMELTSTHTMEITDPEYAILSFREVTPKLIENAKDVLDSKLHDKVKQFVHIKPDMPLKVLLELQSFMFSHVPDKRIKCEMCSKFVRDLSKHMTEAHPPPKHPCPHCGEMVEDNAVKQHLKKTHRGGKLLYCNVCDAEYKTTYSVQPHMIPKSIHVVTCPVDTCKHLLLNQDRLKTHVKRNHKVQEVKVKLHELSGSVLCDFCGKVLKNKQGLRLHLMKTHFSEKRNDATYVCDTCGKVVDSKTKLRKHLRYCQGIKIPCDICGKKYSKDYLCKHKRSHIQLDDSQKYACKYCGKLYALRYKCKAHEATHEGVELKCTICKPRQYFVTLKAAKEHKEKHEKGETITLPPHMSKKQCHLCSLILKNQRNLNAHLRAHARSGSDAQPKRGGRFVAKVLELACYVCLVRYGTQQQFDEHLEAYHPHGVPTPDPGKVLAKCFSYQCSFCLKKLSKYETLKDHEASHRGEKNHVCKYCRRKFFYGNEKSQHMKNCQYKK